MNQFRPLANKLLFLSDRPEDHTGLARVARDIASLAATMPEFKVGFLGRGSQGMAKFPWSTYSYPEATGGWGQDYLAGVTRDFFGSDHGILLSNWDVSRLTWLPSPQGRNWDAWLYAPVDSIGPDGARLGVEQRSALPLFTRVLAASEWGMNVLRNSGRPDADWLPHGIDTNIFRPHVNPRPLLDWSADDIWVGAVMANQARKDFPVAFEAAALLKAHYGQRFRFWLHTDTMYRYWNLYSLASDYGIEDCLHVTTNATDEQMALRYSSCDATILPSACEGFGFPIAESLACGTACVVTDYAAGQELVREECRVAPVTYRTDTVYNVRRAVLSGHGFANAVHGQVEAKMVDREFRGAELSDTVAHLSWDRLKYPWQRWLRQGLK